jgi:hypothetical protein
MAYSVTLKGLTIGSGGVYDLTKGPAGFGVTARAARIPKLGGGVVPASADVAEGGDMTFEVAVLGSTPEETVSLVDALVTAWAPSATTDELTMVMGGFTRRRRGRSLGVDVDYESLWQGNMASARCVFGVFDPFWYGSQFSVSTVVGVITGGVVSPVVSPVVTTGSGTLGDAPVYNSGSAPAPWTAQITGPVTTARLILNGQTVQIDGDIPAGATAYVDSRTRSVIVDGAMRPWVSQVSRWWTIPPGASTFSFRAEAGTGSAVLSWTDTFYG